MFGWLYKRILSEKNLGYAYEKLRPQIVADLGSVLKDSVISILENEEIAEAVSIYGDEFVKGRMQTFWGSVGGKQKGLNYALAEQNPLDQVINAEGGINLAGIIKLILSGGLKGLRGGGAPTYNVRARSSDRVDTKIRI